MLEEFQRILYGDKSLNKNKRKRTQHEYIKYTLVAILLAILINKYILLIAYVPSGSMIPTLNVGDKLLVSKVYNKDSLRRGDIIIFRSKESDEYMVKRLIGIPGDNVTLNNGYVYIDGKLLKEDYSINRDDYTGEYIVPEGKYFFLGDNRPTSKDSRRWKETYINEEDIIGVVNFRIYPFKGIGSIK